MHGGSIECTITGYRKYGVGLEVSCTYKMSGPLKHIKILVKLLTPHPSADRN